MMLSVAIEICRLALDYLNNGTNQNRLQAVASKLFHSLHSLTLSESTNSFGYFQRKLVQQQQIYKMLSMH